MKTAVCLVLLALAGSAVAQNATSPSPEPVAAASPSPAVEASPSPAVASPSPALVEVASPSPAVASPAPVPITPAANVTANATTAATNATDNRVKQYFSSPLYAIQSTPELAELGKLAANSEAAKLLSDKSLVATVFAPNNAAVKAAVAFVSNATGQDAAALAELGVVEALLAYHVTQGAAVLTSRFKNGQVLTMLDGNTTTINVEEGGARRLMQEGSTYFISSDSKQQFKIESGDIQGGKSMIHIIDGVLVPAKLLEQYGISTADLPGVVPGAVSPNGVSPDGSTSRDVPAPTAAAKGSAGKAVAALLAVPTLLAALML